MSRAYSIVQALAEDALLQHTAKAIDTVLKPWAPRDRGYLQLKKDDEQRELRDRFELWAAREGLDEENTRTAWLAVKAMCL